MAMEVVALTVLLCIRCDAFILGRDHFNGEIIDTNTGSVSGVGSYSRDGRPYYSWLKVPYARPPVHQLRFADPEQVEPWKGVLDGTKYGPWCLQKSIFFGTIAGNEDCLYLNIHTPRLSEKGLKFQRKLPVIFYIHCGAYISMGPDTAGLPDYFMDEDVVFVTVSYRLGVLGFLTTGDEIIRGNMGLKDQTMALRWVQENIQYFGGDPKQVTIFGTSAGAASVHQQTLSKLSTGLFQRAISQSGAATNQWGFISLKQSLEKLKEFAEELDCSIEDSNVLAECLREKNGEELIVLESRLYTDKLSLYSPQYDGLGFVPTVEAVDDEKAFIAQNPLEIAARGNAHGVPHLFSHTTNEGILATADFRHDPKNLEKFESEWNSRIRQLFQLEADTSNETVRQIFELYMPTALQSELSVKQRIERYIPLFSDAFFNFDIREAAYFQRRYSPVYFYVYSKTHGPSAWPLVFYEIRKNWQRLFATIYSQARYAVRTLVLGIPPDYYGTDHAEDMFLHFPIPWITNFISDIQQGDEFYRLSKDHVRMVVDFATDHTNVVVRGMKLEPLAKEGPIDVLEINDETRMMREPFEERMKFLHSLDIRGVNKITSHDSS